MSATLHRTRGPALGAALLCFLACAAAGRAQEVPDPDADTVAVPTGPQQAIVPASAPTSGYGQNPSEENASLIEGAPVDTAALRWGTVLFDPHLSYGVSYSTGILASPGHPVSTVLQSFSPGLFLQLSPLWTLDYTPTWEWYSNPLFTATLDHAARLEGKVPLHDWALDFLQTYDRTSEPLVETGRQTPEQSFDTAVNATYGYGSRTLLELGLQQNILTSSAIPDSYEWSTLDWLHLTNASHWDAAIGGGLGYVIVDPGFDMDYLRPEARVTWRPSDALRVDLQGGIEDRAFLGSGGRRLTTPIFSATASDKIGETTTVTAYARREVDTGYIADEVERATEASIGLQQRVLRHFYLGAEVGREEVSYLPIGPGVAAVRGDHTTTFQTSLSTVLLRRITVAVQYSNLRDDSSLAGYGFASNQYGLTLQFKY